MSNGSSLTFETQRLDAGVVITPVGRIDGSNAMNFQDVVLREVGSGKGALVVDLGSLDYISSAGLRVLLLAAKRMQGADRAFSLCNVRDHILEVLNISGFSEILTIHETFEQAFSGA